MTRRAAILVLTAAALLCWCLLAQADEPRWFKEVEPNDTLEQANMIEPYLFVYGGLEQESDVDYYQFSIPEPGTVELSFYVPLFYDEKPYWLITLFNSLSLEPVFSTTCAGFPNTAETYPLELPAGDYHVRIEPYGSELGSRWSDLGYELLIFYTEDRPVG